MPTENLKFIVEADLSGVGSSIQQLITAINNLTTAVQKNGTSFANATPVIKTASAAISGFTSAANTASTATGKIVMSSEQWRQRAAQLGVDTNNLTAITKSYFGSQQKTTTGFLGMYGGAIRAQYALSGIERAFNGNGIQGYVFGLQQTAREFGDLVAMSGSVKGAFSTITKTLIGPAGIVFAIGFAAEIISKVIREYGGLNEALEALTGNMTESEKEQIQVNEALDAGVKSASSQVKAFMDVQNTMSLYHQGLVSGKEALNVYNSELGKTFGKLNDLSAAEDKLNKAAPNFIKYTVLKAAYEQLLGNAAKNAAQQVADQEKPISAFLTFWDNIKNTTGAFLNTNPLFYMIHPNAQGFTQAAIAMGQMGTQLNAADAALNKFNKLSKEQDAINSYTKQAQEIAKQAQQIANAIGAIIGGASGGKGIKSVSDILSELKSKFSEITGEAKIFGWSIEKIGAAKLDALNKAIIELAKKNTPEAIAEAKKLFAEFNEIAKNSFLPVLVGEVKPNTPGIKNPGVPTYISPETPGVPISNPQKLGREQQSIYDPMLKSLQRLGIISDKTLNDMTAKLGENSRAAETLDRAFESIFSSLANGQNPFKALIQTVEQLVIELGAAAATVALLNVLPGGSAILQVLNIASSIPRFANGGYIATPQLAVVGDAPGGEWVLNQGQINNLMANVYPGRKQKVEVSGEFRIDGSSLVSAVRNAEDRIKRRT